MTTGSPYGRCPTCTCTCSAAARCAGRRGDGAMRCTAMHGEGTRQIACVRSHVHPNVRSVPGRARKCPRNFCCSESEHAVRSDARRRHGVCGFSLASFSYRSQHCICSDDPVPPYDHTEIDLYCSVVGSSTGCSPLKSFVYARLVTTSSCKITPPRCRSTYW